VREWYKLLFVLAGKSRRVIPNLSVLWVIGFVLVLSILLDRLLLRPLTAIMKAREGAIGAARDMAESSRARAQAASDELEAKTRAARAEVYRQMEENRRVALATRAELVADTRREVEGSMEEASTRIRTQVDTARAQLERDADVMAGTIVERVLGRRAS
jgi:F-type H+-transporting ATPase subunit b